MRKFVVKISFAHMSATNMYMTFGQNKVRHLEAKDKSLQRTILFTYFYIKHVKGKFLGDGLIAEDLNDYF